MMSLERSELALTYHWSQNKMTTYVVINLITEDELTKTL
jgi:hypothetical protein